MNLKSYNIETEFSTSDKFVIENLIVSSGITLIVVSPKKGKTMLGLNLALCIHYGINFLENKVTKTKVVYYCNELSGRIINERVKGIGLHCLSDLKFYEGTGQILFEDLEKIIKENVEQGYKVFFIDTFSKIKYD